LSIGTLLILKFIIIKITAPELKVPGTTAEINVIVDGYIKENLIK
jgi:hypothetical protein